MNVFVVIRSTYMKFYVQIKKCLYIMKGTWDNSLGIVMGCGLDGQGSIPGRSKNIFLPHIVQASSGAHTALCSVGMGHLIIN